MLIRILRHIVSLILSLTQKEYEDLSVFADAIPKLTGIGVQISESWVWDKLGIPEPQGRLGEKRFETPWD